MSADAVATPVAVHRPVAPEDAARANFYALLARLLNAGPDGRLLHQIAHAPALEPDGDPALARAWNDLVAASSVMDADAGAEEHDALFATMGKPVVSAYAGFYTGAAPVAHPRVRVRADLVALGLAPRADSTEPEDHFGALFEAMRVLIAGGAGRGPASLEEQRRFFHSHIEPAAFKFMAALAAATPANYYRLVAALGAAFIALETESFSLD